MNEQLFLSGAPVLGQVETVVAPVAAATTSPWTIALATTFVSAATGWVIEEVARGVRKKRRR